MIFLKFGMHSKEGGMDHFAISIALVIVFFFIYIDRLKVAAPHPFFSILCMDLFIFCLSPSVMFPPQQLIPNVITL